MLKRAARKLLPSSMQGPARKIYRALRTRKARVRQDVQFLRQWMLNHARGKKQTHLVICGCSRSGTTLLYNMVRYSAQDESSSPTAETFAYDTPHFTSPFVISKHPLDIFNIDLTKREFNGVRDFVHLIMVRDPRDLVSSRHGGFPSQYHQSFDYQLFMKRPIRSLSERGVGAVFDATTKALNGTDRCFLAKYEELVQNPEDIRRLLRFSSGLSFPRKFEDFHTAEVAKGLIRQMNGVRPAEKQTQPAWTNPGRLDRALRQIRLFPQLEEVAAAWGYEPFDEICARYGLEPDEPPMPRGTIVAFHTDDAIYRAEAERFARRLDALGLPYDITVVPPRDQWVENCAMKAEFLRDVRKRLRGPLLYLDVDSYVHADPWPYLSQYDGDAAAYVHQDGELIAACILLDDTAGTAWLLNQWVERQKQNPLEWDQKVLQAIVLEQEANPEAQEISFQRLPPNLCYIFDKQYPYLFGDVLIEQLQASREIKAPDGARTIGRRKRIEELSASI